MTQRKIVQRLSIFVACLMLGVVSMTTVTASAFQIQDDQVKDAKSSAKAATLDKVPGAPEDEAKLAFYTVDHYGNDRDAKADLEMTLKRAQDENKTVLVQVGGDWCGWCKLMTKFIASNDKVRSMMEENYLIMKVTYNQDQKNEEFLKDYPAIKGYPHLFVLNAKGELLHSQDTAELEEGKGYNEEKFVAFLSKWQPKDASQ